MVPALRIAFALAAVFCLTLAAVAYRESQFVAEINPGPTLPDNRQAQAQIIEYARTRQCPPSVVELLESRWENDRASRRTDHLYLKRIENLYRWGALLFIALASALVALVVVLRSRPARSGAT